MKPKPRWVLQQERARARQERLRARQEANLNEMQRYLDLSLASFHQIGEDIAAGRRIKRRGPPRSARVKRLFRRR